MIDDIYLKIVIPCFKEPDILQTLKALLRCDLPKNKVEIIIIINHSTDSSPEIKTYNINTYENLKEFSNKNNTLSICLLPKLIELKQQSVGLARKAGMDLAYDLLKDTNTIKNGIIIALDADCEVEKNYFIAVENHFLLHPKTPAASIYYEHEITDNQLIIEYELHLRYLVNALRWAEHPYAFQTVGSAMAVRAEAYKKQGGMNSRQAGEDFYFLQKMMNLGGFTDILSTKIIPSARISDRVPFGTGRAMQQHEISKTWMSYNFKSYEDIKTLVDFVPNLNQNQSFEPHSEALLLFLKSINFEEKCAEIRKNTTNYYAFRKRFFQYFNGFQVMKFLNYCKENHYNSQPISVALKPLNVILFPNEKKNHAKDLLLRYREFYKNTFYKPK